jgi:hypothetical protein
MATEPPSLARPPALCRRGFLARSTAAIALVAIVSGAIVLSSSCAEPSVAEKDLRPEVRGITVSTHTSNRGWETEELGATFADIAAVGANWVAIHPYARIASNGEVTFQPFVLEAAKDGAPAGPRYLRGPIEDAHRLGLKILIKPHLAYWGSPFRWRGDIAFEHEEDWARFFASYGRWIEAVASATSDADGFVIGTELDRTVQRKEWREIIGRLRAASDVPMTYAANWSDYRQVPFWDALDVIGIQAYFPIAGERPTREELDRGWQRRMAELRRFAHANEKSILFTEIGYSRSTRAAVEPWLTGRGGLEAEALQALCLDAALDSIVREPLVVGAFLWKWFPRPRSVGRDFEMASPALQKVIRAHWMEGGVLEGAVLEGRGGSGPP